MPFHYVLTTPWVKHPMASAMFSADDSRMKGKHFSMVKIKHHGNSTAMKHYPVV
jgi:hypothetical protein